MLKKWELLPLILLGVTLQSTPSSAEVACPKNIATIDQGVLSPVVAKILQNLYLEIGCPMTLLALPGRRGIASFNSGSVDGEIMRLAKAEGAYEREFVRSQKPLFSLTYSLWHHPNRKEKERLKTGYTLGVVWQEDHMKDKRGERFHNGANLFKAYNAGRLSGFLSADMSVRKLVSEGALSPEPIKAQLILSAPMYHYLASEFAPFMTLLSAKILERKAFSHISEMQN